MNLLLLFMLVTALGIGNGALTQDTIYCSDLNVENCDLLVGSQAAMRTIDGAAFSFDVDLIISGIPDDNLSVLEFGLAGGGDYVFNDTVADSGAPQPFTGVFARADSDVILSFTIPEEAADAVSGLNFDSLVFDIRVVDGVAYLNTETLAELDPSGSLGSGWIGLDIVGLLGALLSESGLFDAEPLSAPGSAALIERHTAVERLDDEVINGQDVAVFQTSINFETVFADEGFGQYFGNTLDDPAAAAEVADLATLYSQLFANSGFVTTQRVRIDNGLLLTADTVITLLITPETFDENAGASDEDPLMLDVLFNIVIELDGYGEVAPVSVPEQAFVLPFETLLQNSSGN